MRHEAVVCMANAWKQASVLESKKRGAIMKDNQRLIATQTKRQWQETTQAPAG